MSDVKSQPGLSFAQRMALMAAFNHDDTDWVRSNTIDSLVKRGLIRWVDSRNAYSDGRGGYITTPPGTALAKALEPTAYGRTAESVQVGR